MQIKVLIADDDMDAQRLMDDVVEINFRDVVIERALSLQSFWKKVSDAGADAPYNFIFLNVEYIKEEPDGFLERLKAANPNTTAKLILMGSAADAEACGEDIKQLPHLDKPFSLDEFEEVVKAVQQ